MYKPMVEMRMCRLLAVFVYLASLFFNPGLASAALLGTLKVSSLPAVQPNDPLFKKENFLAQIQAGAAWSLTTGSVRTTVAIIDSGVDIYHPDLRENVWINQGEIPGDGIDNDVNGFIDDVSGWDFVKEVPDPRSKFSDGFRAAGIQHGTLVAGIIAGRGNNNMGIAGVSWRTKILPLRVLDGNGDGDVINVVRAVDYAIAKKVDVINMSFVSDGDSGLLRDAITRAYRAGIVVVAATGNDANNHGVDLRDKPVYPACDGRSDGSVIGVGALDDLDQKAKFSNYGECVDVFAPGMNFFSTQVLDYEHPGFDSAYGSGWSGTSLSTAVVSGAVALMKSVNPDFTPLNIRQIFHATSDSLDTLNPSYAGRMGYGKLNLYRAVQHAVEMSRSHGEIIPEPIKKSLVFTYPLNASVPGNFFTRDGSASGMRSFLPFGKGVPFSVAALKNNTTNFYVAGSGKGSAPRVRVFDASFRLVSEFNVYESAFRGGISVAVGDVDGDGVDEIVTVPGAGGGPHVKIFDQFGTLRYHFLAYDKKFREGLHIALGDLNTDGKSDIVTTSQKNNQGDVRVFSPDGILRTQFFAYPKMKVGSRIVLGDLDGDGGYEIITAPITGIAPVKVFTSIGKLKASYYPFGKTFAGGVSLSVGDLNQDRRDEVVCAPAGKGGAQVRIFDAAGRTTSQFFVMKNYTKGIGVAVLR